jgi:hypothetical protein
LAQALYRKRKEVWVYDVDQRKTRGYPNECDNWQDCFNAAQVLFGCTGKDFAFGADTIPRGLPKTMMSLSSRDVEFRSFILNRTLRLSDPPQRLFDPLQLEGMLAGPYSILNGGFPINFDRTKEWETSSEIALTRALVLLGVLQALCVRVAKVGGMIDDIAQFAQQRLVGDWLKLQKLTPQNFGVDENDFRNPAWWAKDSDTEHYYRGEERYSSFVV